MGLQVYELPAFGDSFNDGVVIVCTTSWVALPLSVNSFVDAEDAERFLEWLPTDPRRLGADELERLSSEWVKYPRRPCSGCGEDVPEHLMFQMATGAAYVCGKCMVEP